jgi:predicted dehydrogenase
MSEQKQINVAIIGTGIFATKSHFPSLNNSEYFKPVACYNRTTEKAEKFSQLVNPPLKVYNELDDAFKDPEIDLIDALLPVQYNVNIVEKAVKFNKNIVIEKPIAANINQAREIVKIAEQSPNILIAVNEHWVYLKAVNQLKTAITKIGKVIGFNYHSTGSFNFNNQYLTTSWRQKPEHVGGFLSDGGVHQLALLTSVLGNVESLNARTIQVRPQSGDVDVVWALCKMESGVIGSFNYGSSFGNKEKKGYFEILGDNGSIYFDFSPKNGDRFILRTGGLTAEDEKTEQEFHIENENWSTATEFDLLGKELNGITGSVICWPRVAFHHLALVDAMVKSSQNDGNTVVIERP